MRTMKVSFRYLRNTYLKSGISHFSKRCYDSCKHKYFACKLQKQKRFRENRERPVVSIFFAGALLVDETFFFIFKTLFYFFRE